MPDRLITDVFQIEIPNGVPAVVQVLTPKGKRVRFDQVFTVAFVYQLGIPAASGNFYVTWEDNDDIAIYGTPTIISIDPAEPRHLYPNNLLVHPKDWQRGIITAQAPAFPDPPPPGHSESSKRLVYLAHINVWQDDP